jgi:hypothetical protein
MCSGVCEGWNEDGVKATKAWCANINYLKGYMRVRNLNAFQTKSCTHETKPLCDQKPKDPSECFQQATSFRSYLCHRLTQILQRCRSQLSRARSKRQAIRPRSSNAAHIHQRPESLTLTPQIRLHIYCQSALTLVVVDVHQETKDLGGLKGARGFGRSEVEGLDCGGGANAERAWSL